MPPTFLGLTKLQPNDKCLGNKTVLAQAWKKAHEYIRSTNWYADTFELDRSAIELENLLDLWISNFFTPDFSFAPLQLIPAPKTHDWTYERISIMPFLENQSQNPPPLSLDEKLTSLSHAWIPKNHDEATLKPLRPLAHITIRDQTIMTALMMCLAEEIESIQGDTSTCFEEVHERRICSYGNRLYCRYEDRTAKFNWGNSTSYSKYFSDYRQFLSRPAYFGYEALQTRANNEQVYEIHLDIEKFFDRVDRSVLCSKLSTHTGEVQYSTNNILNAFINWEWADGSEELYQSVCSKEDEAKAPKGIPQGLVAGGFLSNVYLLDFDNYLANIIGTDISNSIRLIDYCRYVDDIRLIVVSTDNPDKVKIAIHNLLKDELANINLALNPEKTKVEHFRSRGPGISFKLKEIQSKVSGPLSINEVDEQLGHLEGIISLAEILRANDFDSDNKNPLALVESPTQDVREDTLLRFSANKIHSLLKQKRSLYAQEVDSNNKPKPGSWDYLQERMARKFIACWSKDPSLVLLLKKGLEQFPDKRLLAPVTEQLSFVRKRESKKQNAIADYCLCEIFRHSATTIHLKNSWANPAHADIENFFESLQELAVEILEEDSHNEHLKEQAKFLLLVRNDSLGDIATNDTSFDIITKLVKGYRRISCNQEINQLIINCVLAYQLAIDKELVLRSIDSFLNKLEKRLHGDSGLLRNSILPISRNLAISDTTLFNKLYKYSSKKRSPWLKNISHLAQKLGLTVAPIEGDLNRFCKTKSNGEINLLGVLKRANNPFSHENSVLALLDSVLNSGHAFEYDTDLTNTKVSCSNWSEITRLTTELTVDLAPSDDPIFPIPTWVDESAKPLYRVGMFLRSCLIGGLDWTDSATTYDERAGYKGIKSSYYKRQLGMSHGPEYLQGETATMTSWLSGLMYHLLQWPGAKVANGQYDWPKEWNISELKKLVSKRIDQQRGLYCQSSAIPTYVEKLSLGWPEDKKDLNVVMVQSLLPKKRDFMDHGFLLDTPIYRARHRRHIASVSELILHKIASQRSIIDDQNDRKANVDLIVWPELSVNREDIDILRRLSDKTGAIIYAGLTFRHLPGIDGPNNTSIWIVPKQIGEGRQFVTRLQGKENLMKDEAGKAKPWRPYQLMLELIHPAFPKKTGFVITGSICYDATDIKLSSDLKGKSDAYIIPALNKDVSTFDSMVDALFYHMYQHVVLVNTGEFGGSVAKAPYKERYDKLITHVHGTEHVSINLFSMNMFDFRDIGKQLRSGKEVKTQPAG